MMLEISRRRFGTRATGETARRNCCGMRETLTAAKRRRTGRHEVA